MSLWLVCILFFLSISWFSDIATCFSLILSFLCPSLGIKNFSKNFWLLLLENKNHGLKYRKWTQTSKNYLGGFIVGPQSICMKSLTQEIRGIAGKNKEVNFLLLNS
jgi:hypothetical protein